MTRSPRVGVRRSHPSTWIVVLVGLAAALVSVLLVGGAHSASQASGLIVFTRADGIYSMHPDGSGVRVLQRGGVAAGASSLAWSQDGRRLAFTSGQQIWTMAADGSDLRQLVSAGQIGVEGVLSPSWSPLGRRIAFVALGKKDRDIWVVNADGTNAHRLLRTPKRWELQVDWSPFGNRFAVTVSATAANFDLYVMQTTGKHVRAVSAGWMVSAMMPRWSPWGHTLAYMAWPGSAWDSMHDAEIWVAEVSGSGYARRLTHNRVVDSNPAWSPDGSKIVFLRGPTAHNIVSPAQRSADEIYVMNADGTGVTRLTYNRVGEGGLAWQPVLWTASRER